MNAEPTAPTSGDDSSNGPVDVTLHEEHAHVGVTDHPYRIVRIHRRIITEIRHVDIEVRTEVLDIDWHASDPSAPAEQGSHDPERIEIVLHGEEPEIHLVTRAKERITLHRVVVPGTTDIDISLRSERIALDAGKPPSS